MFTHQITPDLELRLLQPSDAASLFSIVDGHRSYLREWLPWVDEMVKLPDAQKFIARRLRDNSETKAFTAGIWSGGQLVGAIGHNRIDWKNRMANPGWWLLPEAQGKGIMTQCCKVVFAHAFNQLSIDRICVGVATENLRGQTIVKRLGFMQVSTLRRAERLRGRSVDHYIYSLASPSARPPTELI